MNENQNSRIYGVIVTFLLLLSAGIGWFFWQKSKTMLVENERKEKALDSLTVVRAGLERELDSLQLAYADLRTENETLQGRIATAAAQMAQKDSFLQKIKSNAAAQSRDLEALRGQVADLQKMKTEYETIIGLLRSENEQLKNENTALKGENTALKGTNDQLSAQVSDLSEKLAEQIKRTQSATFRATSFRVEVEKRGDRLTTKARKAREIMVSFDLADVPEPYQGAQKLYLVITDEKGKPIESANPMKATIMAPAGSVEITAQAIKQVVLERTSRQNFVYKLDDRLKKGNYVVAIYCDKGLLGASSFKLI